MHIQHILQNSSLVRQIREKRPDVEPVHFIVSLLGMTIFPFIAKPILFSDTKKFNALMEKRKALVARWAKAILET